MTLTHRSATAAAVLVTAAAVLLGACGSGSGHDTAAKPSGPGVTAPAGGPAATGTAPGGTASGGPRPAGAQPSATGSAGATGGTAGAADGGDSGDGADAPGSAADAPKVPDAKLTPPGGGTFTKQQKTYLSGRVPKGTDPVAVLEGGQELCDRLARTVKIDKDAAASAILTGDISRSGADAAVHTLCPEQQPVLDAVDHGFGDGTLTVAAKPVPGTSVAPGGYRAPHPSPACNWRVSGADGRTLSSGRATGTSAARLTVPAAARGITSSGCYAWLATGGT